MVNPLQRSGAVTIPDILASWPYKRTLSKHYAQAIEESNQWVTSIGLFDDKGRGKFFAGDISLLATLAYSSRDHKEFIRLGCDLMNFFVVDEYTDIADAEMTKKIIDNICRFFDSRDPMSIQASDVLEEMTQQFWDNALKLTSPDDNCIENFAKVMQEYLQAVVVEAEERDNAGSRVQNIAEYLALRRGTCGGKPTLALFEFGLDLPKEVMLHPVIAQLTFDAVEMIYLVNDLHSYSREYSRDRNCHNILTYVMQEKKSDLSTALKWLEEYANTVSQRFRDNLNKIPSWGSTTDAGVKIYVDGIGQWVRGNDDWSFEGRRYYRGNGRMVKETRRVAIKNYGEEFLVNEGQLKEMLRMPAGNKPHELICI